MFVVRCEFEKFHFRYSQHFIFFVTEKPAKQTRMFVPGRLLQPSLMFASKAGTLEKHSSLLGPFISC
jgi:hypothetical protein